MNFHSFFERFTREIWLQVIVLLLFLWGLLCLTGMSFERVENSSRAHIASGEDSSAESSALTSEEKDEALDSLFSEESGAFGNWEEFSDMPRVSSETARPPVTSRPAEPSSEPSPEPSSDVPESSSDSLEPPVSSETPAGGPDGAIVIDPNGPTSPIEGSVESSSSSSSDAENSVPAESSEPSEPVESQPAESSVPAEPSAPGPGPSDSGSSPAGGASPDQAPEIGGQE